VSCDVCGGRSQSDVVPVPTVPFSTWLLLFGIRYSTSRKVVRETQDLPSVSHVVLGSVRVR
jgi:hypothetical protein